MKKKILLTLLAILCICALSFGIVSCSDGNDNDTNVEEPDVPLTPDATCQHTNLSHETETSSTCNVHGHTEYWFCGDCNKYFANEACTVETTLAAVTKVYGEHKYGEWIGEEPANCTDNGTLGHYHCSVCQKNFDAEKEELDSLVILAHHSYDEEDWIAEVPAVDCETPGTKGHYHCDACGGDFDRDGNEYDGLFNSLTITVPHELTLVPEVKSEDATCINPEHAAYWECDVCGNVFEDEHGIIPADIIEIPGEHNYVYTYNYTTCEYDGVCSHSSAHTDTVAAGTEAYPYLANDEASLKAAVGKGGYVKLMADITADIVIAQDKEVNLNLNGHRLSNSASHTILNNGTLTLIGGGTVYNGTHKMAALSNTGVATVNGVTLERIYVAKTDTTALNSHYTIDNTNGGTMTLINATVISENNMVTSLVRNIGATMTIESGEYTTANIIIKNDDEGVLTVNGGKFVGIQSIQNWGTATINGGEVTYVKTAIWSSKYKSTTYINDNNFGGELVLEYNENYVGKWLTDDSAPVLKVKNGISHTEPQIRIAISVHEVTSSDGYSIVTAEESGYTVYTLSLPTFVKDATALKAALANGGNIKLLANIETADMISIMNSLTSVIDFNGHTVSGSAQVVFYVGYQTNVPNVTFKNGTINATASNGMAIYSMVNSTMKLENVNINAGAYGVYSTGSFDITGGKIEAGSKGVMAHSTDYNYVDTPTYKLKINIEGTEIVSGYRGVEVHTADVMLNNVNITVTGNNVPANDAGAGVAVFRDTRLEMENCVVSANSTNSHGLSGNGSTANSITGGKNTDIILNLCEISGITGIYHPQVSVQ